MIYIATNKDNKDAIMHYGVKGMRWGKRGGRRAGEETIPENTIPENIIEEQYIYEDYASNSPKNHHRRPGKGSKTISRKNNISTGARPQQNKLSTSQKTSSAPDKRIKQYFRDKIDRQRAEERKQEQQRRVDARRRQQDLKKEQIEEKYWHGAINNAMHQYPYLENEYKQWKRENAGKKHTHGTAWKKDREYNNRKTYRR